MAEREQPYSADKQGFFKVVSGDIVRPIAFTDDVAQEIIPDSPELSRKREANRNRIEHNVFTYTGHDSNGWVTGMRSSNGRERGAQPLNKPRGYSGEFWEANRKK